jgi:hypothetical protein
MTRTMGFSKIEPDAVGRKHVQNAPQQVGSASPGDRIENDQHERIESAYEKDFLVPSSRVILMTIR